MDDGRVQLVGGPPHVWEPHGPVDVKCRRCGVQQNWQGAWDTLVAELETTRAIVDEAQVVANCGAESAVPCW